MAKTVATTVIETLRDIGVRYVFGVPSGGWVDYMEALRITDGIDFILATHEGGAGMMADVCGRLTGVPGACFGTYGPGATNLATGVGEALLDRSPMIALTDEMPEPMRGRITQMGIDHQALFEPLTKKTTRLTADGVKDVLHAAAQVAMTDRQGPVHVGLPAGLSSQPAADDGRNFPGPAAAPRPDEEVLQKAWRLIEAAQRPILAIGLGAVRGGAAQRIVAFAEKHRIPVVLTPMAKGVLVEDHPLYVGVLFHALSDIVGETHKLADLVIGVGYDPVEFNYEAWMPKAPLVSIDTDPVDIDRGAYDVGCEVVGDVCAALDGLLQFPPSTKAWDLSAIAARRDAMFQRLTSDPTRPFGPMAALEVLRSVLPDDGFMACDVGAHTHLIGQKWPTPAPGRQIMTNGWSTMGFGIPAAIAAKLTHQDKMVCAVVGDGGFLMTVGELATAVRYGVKIVVVVLTDNDLALIRIKQEKKGNPIYGTPVRDGGAIGADNLFGVPVSTARDAESFRRLLEKAFAADGPQVVEAIVDSREYDAVVLRKDKA